MAIVVRLDRLIRNQNVVAKKLACAIGISENNLSRIKTGQIKAIRFSTLDGLCRELNCRPGDFIDYIPDSEVNPTKHIVCWSEEVN